METVVLEANVKGIGNLKELRSELNAAKEEMLNVEVGSEAFNRVQKKVSDLTGKLKDLGDSARIQGSGVERLTQSFGLMQEALATGNIDKAKVALTGVGQAMKAIPIFFLIEGIKLLIDNWDAVSKSIQTFFGHVNTTQKKVDDLTAAIKEQEGQTTILKATLQGEIEVMTAQGASVDAILSKKKELMKLQVDEINQQIEVNKAKLEAAKAEYTLGDATQSVINVILYKMGLEGKAFDRQLDMLKERKAKEQELQNEIDKLSASKLALEYKYTTESIQANIKKNQGKAKSDEDYYKMLQWMQAREAELENAEIDRKEKEDADFKAALIRGELSLNEQMLAAKKELNERLLQEDADFKAAIREQNALDDERAIKSKEELNARLEDLHKRSEEAKQEATRVGLDAAQSLSNTFFQIQLNRAKGNAAEELKIRKKMFEVDKAFNITRAIQDGIRSVQAALTIPPPGGQILAAANGILAAANVAKIAATKFDAGNTDTSTGGSVPTLQSTQVPSVQAPQASQLLDQNGKPITQAQREEQVIKAYLTTHEVDKKLKNSRRLEEQSKF